MNDNAIDATVEQLILLAKEEDLGTGDLSTSLQPDPDSASTFSLIAKAQGVFAGQEIAQHVLDVYDRSITIAWEPGITDRFSIKDIPTKLAVMRGPLSGILAAERVLLNFLQRLSGVATLTRQYVNAITGTNAQIYDTRKTTPGWRALEKYAVRCGGGRNHRAGLYDAVLIKDNHLAGISPRQLPAFIFELLNRLSITERSPSFVEVEADDLEQVEALLSVVGIDIVLLDNFSLPDLRRAVELRDSLGLKEKIELEASGGVSLSTVRAIAETGVERISVGAITHSAVALDLSLDRFF